MAWYIVNGRRQLDTGLLLLTGCGIQRAEAPVAVGLERAHAQFLGKGEGLAVVAGGGFARWGCLARRALAQEPQGPGLGTALLILVGEVERLRGPLMRLVQAARQQRRLTEAGDHECPTP